MARSNSPCAFSGGAGSEVNDPELLAFAGLSSIEEHTGS
jgi:hypothetical protein